jgi:hypothetical protein
MVDALRALRVQEVSLVHRGATCTRGPSSVCPEEAKVVKGKKFDFMVTP